MQLYYFLQGKMGNTWQEITAQGPVSISNTVIQLIFLSKVRQLKALELIIWFYAWRFFGRTVDKYFSNEWNTIVFELSEWLCRAVTPTKEWWQPGNEACTCRQKINMADNFQ